MLASFGLIGRAGLGLVLVVLSALALALIIEPTVVQIDLPPAQGEPPRPATFALKGIVEPSSEMISVAAPVAGVVSHVRVRPGDTVAMGDVLFVQDDRQARVQLARAKAVQEAAAVDLADQTARLRLYTDVADHRAVSTDERDRVRFAAEKAQVNLAVAVAEVSRARIELDRLTVRAPIGGMVLKVNVRPGEYAAGGDAATAPVMMGQVHPLHVRVRIDADEVGRVRRGGIASGSLVGGGAGQVELSFVRFEPEARTDAATSRRMIEAIYAFDPEALPAFVGQQVQVAIAPAPPRRAAGGGRPSPPGPVASQTR